MAFLTNEKQINAPEDIVTSLDKDQTKTVYDFLISKNPGDASITDLEALMSKYSENPDTYQKTIDSLPVSENLKYESGFSLFKHKIPMWIFLIVLMGLVVWAIEENLSLIPLLGLVSCLYMMAELSVWNWIYFTCWLLIGLLIYFGFSRKNSKLNGESQ